MSCNISKTKEYTYGVVDTDDAGVSVLCFTVDLHRNNSVVDQATYLFYEDMLMAGAGKMSRDQFLHQLGILGAGLTARVSDGRLAISVKCKQDAFSKVLKLVEEMLLQPAFTKSELTRGRKLIENQLEQYKDNARALALEGLRNASYRPNDRRSCASIKQLQNEVKKVDIVDVKKLHERVFAGRWQITLAGGELEQEQFSKALKNWCKRQSIDDEVKSVAAQKAPKSDMILQEVPGKPNIEFSIGLPVPLTLSRLNKKRLQSI